MGALQGRAKPEPFTRVQEYFRNKRNKRREKKKLKKEIKSLKLKAKARDVEQKVEDAFQLLENTSTGLTSETTLETDSKNKTEAESTEVSNEHTEVPLQNSGKGSEELTTFLKEWIQDDVAVEIPVQADGQVLDLQVAPEQPIPRGGVDELDGQAVDLQVAQEPLIPRGDAEELDGQNIADDVDAGECIGQDQDKHYIIRAPEQSPVRISDAMEFAKHDVKVFEEVTSLNYSTKLNIQTETSVLAPELSIKVKLPSVHVASDHTVTSPAAAGRDTEVRKGETTEPNVHLVKSELDEYAERPNASDITQSPCQTTLSLHSSLASESIGAVCDEVEKHHVFDDPEMYPGREIISDYERYIPSADWPYRPPSLSVTIDSRWSGYFSYRGHYDCSDTDWAPSCTSSYVDDITDNEEVETGVQQVNLRIKQTGKSDAWSGDQKGHAAPDRPSHLTKAAVTSWKRKTEKPTQRQTKYVQGNVKALKRRDNVTVQGKDHPVDADNIKPHPSYSIGKRVPVKQESAKPTKLTKTVSDARTARNIQAVNTKRASTAKVSTCKDTPAGRKKNNMFTKPFTSTKLEKPKSSIQAADMSRNRTQPTTKRQELPTVKARKPSLESMKSSLPKTQCKTTNDVKPKLAIMKKTQVSFSERKLPVSKGVSSAATKSVIKDLKTLSSRFPSCKDVQTSNSERRSSLTKARTLALPPQNLQVGKIHSSRTGELNRESQLPKRSDLRQKDNSNLPTSDSDERSTSHGRRRDVSRPGIPSHVPRKTSKATWDNLQNKVKQSSNKDWQPKGSSSARTAMLRPNGVAGLSFTAPKLPTPNTFENKAKSPRTRKQTKTRLPCLQKDKSGNPRAVRSLPRQTPKVSHPSSGNAKPTSVSNRPLSGEIDISRNLRTL